MRAARRLILAGVAALLAAGCNTVPAEKFQGTQRELQAAREEVRRLQQQLAAEQQATRELQQQLASARGLDEKALAMLPLPERIELDRRSGGYDADGRVGDDGIVLHIRPVDRDQHVVKAAGRLHVALFDLAAPEDRRLIAEYHFDEPTLREKWHGRLMTNHFTVRCPWPAGRLPDHSEVTARVVFTEFLTGRPLVAQEVFRITFPPDLASVPSN